MSHRIRGFAQPTGPSHDTLTAGHQRARGATVLVWVFLTAVIAGAGAASTRPETPSQPLVVSAGPSPGFTRLPSDTTGVFFTNRLSDESAAANQIRLNGSGVALGDVDGDGRIDLFLCNLEASNRLYRNLGSWRFQDITAASPAIALPGRFCTGTALADIDGDGDLDLFINALGEGTRLFLNDGTGTFTEKTDAALERRGGAMSLALGDPDGDGDLDLYVANYRTTTIRTTGFALLNVDGQRRVPAALKEDLELTPDGRVLEHGEPDCFYLNDGTGQFVRVPWTTGGFLDEKGEPLQRTPRDWALSAMFRDINQDGLPDLYICNDFHSEDRIWINQGGQQFRALPPLAVRQTSTFSMSADFADLDGDGWDDFFVSDMLDLRRERRLSQITAMEPNPSVIGRFDDRPQYARNALQWNRGDGTYAEISAFAGLDRSGWSWSAVFLDVDLDGREDLLLTTGHLFDTQDLDAAARIDRMGPVRRDQIARKLLMLPRLPMPKMAFRNEGGFRFVPAGSTWRFDEIGVAHGLAMGDLDGDGDQDVVVNNLNAAATLYRNDASAPRIAVRLRGSGANTAGIGARVELRGGGRLYSQEMLAGGRYLSSDAPTRTFAWPATDAVQTDPPRLTVRWRSGEVTTLPGIRSNVLYEISEPQPAESTDPNASRRVDPPSPAHLWFEDLSARLNHRHSETAFDDFARQPLLPRKLSQQGPGLAWIDGNADGWVDLVVGSGAGGAFAFLQNQSGTAFHAPAKGQSPSLSRDGLGIIADPSAPSCALVAFSRYEEDARAGHCLRRWDPANGTWNDVWPDLVASMECLAAADRDGDGDLDLFVGGRSVPGRYPEPATSLLLTRVGERWVVDADHEPLFQATGLVTGAVWTDLSNDGFPELVLSGDWGPLRILRNQRGRLGLWDPEIRGASLPPNRTWHLSDWTGWWTTILAGDWDGDGRMDLMAGNWGWNTSYRTSADHPLRLHFGDFDQSGSLDLIEASYDVALANDYPDRDLETFRRAVPALVAAFDTHRAYAMTDVASLLARSGMTSRQVAARSLATTAFFNRGDFWECHPLPDAAQHSPVTGGTAADFDGDGDVDVFLAQNFFPYQPATPRSDAGRGLLLENDGQGRFAPVAAGASGLLLYGEQRGSAAADFDHDGRVDLAVGQNGAETRLFRNTKATPGLRVRAVGGPGNPLGIGVALRLDQKGRLGPRREIRSGSGGISHDAAEVVVGGLSSGEGAMALLVQWPGRDEPQHIPIPPGSREVLLRRPE
ncbi:MAG: VCBS repeat-containing protein [Verrucomicrobiales bacterium]|nr:VCBS repeat-containing protein [Verrucomicrobiales bacterium]